MTNADSLLLVFTAPVAGREDEYNAWYDERHLPDVVAVPGVRSGRRYVQDEANSQGDFAYRYAAVYELDRPFADVLDDMNERIADGRMPLSDALDRQSVAVTVWRARGAQEG